MRKAAYFCALAMLWAAVPAFALTTKSVGEGVTAAEVAAKLTGPGTTISNVTLTGSTRSFGTFSGGTLGVSSGIIISTGDIATAIGPNNSQGAGTDLGQAGDSQLNGIVTPNTTHDAAVLEFDVVTKTVFFNISYVFASEEYREYVDQGFNDVFAFYLDGHNIAIAPGTDQRVTVDSINHLRNTAFYRDNENGADTQFDGFTTLLYAFSEVEPNVSHHIKIAIADTGDGILDSAVFIAEGGIAGATAPLLAPQLSEVLLSYAQPVEVLTQLFFVYDTVPFTLSASGLPNGTVTFSPVLKDSQGRYFTTVKILAGNDTPQGSFVINLISTTADTQRVATILAHVDCRAPAILGTGQPTTQTVDRGRTATFTVSPIGAPPFRYQWYTGYTGMDRSPIAGATGATFTTPAVNDTAAYWVRITNPCGSFDSLTALATPR
jgi:hypothetical protein